MTHRQGLVVLPRRRPLAPHAAQGLPEHAQGPRPVLGHRRRWRVWPSPRAEPLAAEWPSRSSTAWAPLDSGRTTQAPRIAGDRVAEAHEGLQEPLSLGGRAQGPRSY